MSKFKRKQLQVKKGKNLFTLKMPETKDLVQKESDKIAAVLSFAELQDGKPDYYFGKSEDEEKGFFMFNLPPSVIRLLFSEVVLPTFSGYPECAEKVLKEFDSSRCIIINLKELPNNS